jgi:hypothetical protein
MSVASQRFDNVHFRGNAEWPLPGNGSITIDTAATNTVTIQNSVRYSIGREGIEG